MEEDTSFSDQAKSEHYRMLQEDPMYRLEFELDVFREEISSYSPRWDACIIADIIADDRERKLKEIDRAEEPEWSKKQWNVVQQMRAESKKQRDVVQQVRAEIKYLENKLNEHLDKPIPKRKEIAI